MANTADNVADNRITLRAFVTGLVLCGVFAALTVYFIHRRELFVTSTQIPVLPYALLFLTILLVNPILRLTRRLRPFSTAEILTVFIMGAVSSSVSSFGLSAQLIPISGSLFNSAWYNDQTKWNLHIAPYVNDRFFLAADGLREAARDHAEAVFRVEHLESRHRLAISATRVPPDIRARAAWEAASPPLPGAPSPEAFLERYPADWAAARSERDVARQRLAVIEAEAFERVDLFRRGLPRDLRAFPGLFPSDTDTFSTYAGRVRRLIEGRRSLAAIAEANQALTSDPQTAAQRLGLAAERLQPIADLVPLANRRAALEQELADRRQAAADLGIALDSLYQQARQAPTAELAGLQNEIRDRNRDRLRLTREQRATEMELARIQGEELLVGRVATAITSIEELAAVLPTLPPETARAAIHDLTLDFRRFDASLDRYFLGDLPWKHWVGPLARWGVLIGMTYLVLMSLNVLIFRQWAHHEKLTYPLAELPETLAGLNDPGGGRVPAIFRGGLFWVGFSISGTILAWNLLSSLDLLPGMQAIALDIYWRPYIEKTQLEGLLPSTRSSIFFTMIGLAFLTPPRIAFSLWFFQVLYMLQLLLLVWMGHGVNEDSFPTEWWFTMNFRTAEGGGALVVFSSVVLFKCRRTLLCCLRPGPIADLEVNERRELRLASALFLAGSAAVIVMLWRGLGAGLGYSIFYFVGMLLITVGLVRAVAEGGVLGFQVWANPFHFIRTAFGMNKEWTSPALFTPLMVYHAVLFLDVKTFIAPAMANALKVRDDLKLSRARFHGALFLAIALAAVVAVTTELMLSYSSGSNRMSGWFHTQLPQISTYGHISQTAMAPPAASPGERLWIVTGAGAMGLLLFFRQFLFWLPHPIGMIMLVNPLMKTYWFSILIGWLAKSLVSKYGSRDLYRRTRQLFIGLIVGELILVILSMALPYFMDIPPSRIIIDLNKGTN